MHGELVVANQVALDIPSLPSYQPEFVLVSDPKVLFVVLIQEGEKLRLSHNAKP